MGSVFPRFSVLTCNDNLQHPLCRIILVPFVAVVIPPKIPRTIWHSMYVFPLPDSSCLYLIEEYVLIDIELLDS